MLIREGIGWVSECGLKVCLVTDVYFFLLIGRSSFEEPRIAEGFQEIVKVNFVPHFDNKKNEKLYFSYLV